MAEELPPSKTVRITIESGTDTVSYEMEDYTYRSSSKVGEDFRDLQIHAWAGLHAEPCPRCNRRDLPEHKHLPCFEVRFYPGLDPRAAPFAGPVRVCAEGPEQAADCAVGLIDAPALVEQIRGKDPAPFSPPSRCLARVQIKTSGGHVPTWILMQTAGRGSLFALSGEDAMTGQPSYLSEQGQ